MRVIFLDQPERVNDHVKVSKRSVVKRVLVIEDDGTEDGGRTIAKFWKRADAFSVADKMGWIVLDETE